MPLCAVIFYLPVEIFKLIIQFNELFVFAVQGPIGFPGAPGPSGSAGAKVTEFHDQ